MEKDNQPVNNELESTVEKPIDEPLIAPVESSKETNVNVDEQVASKEAEKTVSIPKEELEEEAIYQDYDPLAAFEQVTSNLEGLPPLKKANPSTSTEKNDEPSENESTKEEKKKEAPQTINYQEDTSDYKFEDLQNDKPSKIESSEQKGARARLKKRGAKAMVSGGDKAQATLAKVVFDWRASGGLDKAKEDRDKLVKKVTSNQPLSQQEKARLSYAQDFISKHEQSKEQFERQIHFSDDDKEELIGLLEDYFALSNYEPSPVFTMVLIIGATLFANFYTAFTMHPTYNPPTSTS